MSLGLHLFWGRDRARKLSRIQELSRSLEVSPLDYHRFDGAKVSSGELIGCTRQRPSASRARLIVVDDAQRLEHQAATVLVNCAQLIAQSACVVLLVESELSVRHPLSRISTKDTIKTERFTGTKGSPTRPFALVDALGARDVAGAFEALREQMANGKGPPELLGLIAWQLQRWILIRHLTDAGYSPARICAVAQLKSWQVERLRSEISGRSLASLRNLLTRCWRLDADVKSGRTPPWLAAEQLVVEVCQPSGLDMSVSV